MSYGALGLVEVLGSCNAVVVLDQMLKTSEVEFRTWHTKCGGLQEGPPPRIFGRRTA